MSRHRFGWRRLGVLSVIAGALIVSGATPAAAHDDDDNNYFTVDIDGTTAGALPETWAGDADATIAITIKNLSSQKLGSANVTVPSPFTVVSAPGDTVAGGPVLELRNLNLAKNVSTTVTITVDVRTCAPATPAAFGITAKKNYDYSGSSFSLKSPYDKQVNVIGKCGLAFDKQPQDAKKDLTITSVAFTIGGDPIKVIVVDASPTQGPAAFYSSTTPIVLTAVKQGVADPKLTGTISVNPSGGQASFAPIIGVSASDYVFLATSAELNPSAASSTFDIVDAQATCAQTGTCATSATSTNGTTATASFSNGGAATNLTVSIGAADVPFYECTGYPKGSSPVSQFAFTGNGGDDRTGTFSITIPNASWFVIIYQVCWASPVDFVTKSGKLASVNIDTGDNTPKPGSPGQTLKVGLLPNCKKWWWNDHWDWDDHFGFPNPTIETLPCISSRKYNWSTRTATIEVKTTGHDPWAY